MTNQLDGAAMPGFSSENLEMSSENHIFVASVKKAQNAFAHVAKHVLRRKDGVPAQIVGICQKSFGLEHFCENRAIWLDWRVTWFSWP